MLTHLLVKNAWLHNSSVNKIYIWIISCYPDCKFELADFWIVLGLWTQKSRKLISTLSGFHHDIGNFIKNHE